MRYLCWLILTTLPCWSQTIPSTGHANSAPCSIANTGNGNKVQITCGIGKKQGDQMIAILNKILAEQLDPDAVMKKLDEILHAVNPNAATTIYFCNGGSRTAGPGLNTGMQVIMNAGPDPYLQQMIDMLNRRPITTDNSEALLHLCSTQMEAKPEWLTPRLFCSAAYALMGDNSNASKMLASYDQRKGPGYDEDTLCSDLSNKLHAGLDQRSK